jgi:hypothetical protein
MKMRQVLASGEKVCVHNPSPRFFDISFVYRPADPTGFMLKKVANSGPAWEGYSAEAGEVAEAYEQKIADERKLSDIRKQLLGRVSAERVNKDIQKYKNVARQNAKNRKPAKDEELDKLSQYPLSVIASTFAAKNAALSAGDVTRLFLKRAGMTSPDWLVDRVVAMQPVFDALCCYDPSIREKTSSLIELHDRHVNPALFPLVQAWVEKHAGLTDYVRDSLYEPSSVLPTLSVGPGALYRASEPGRTDLLTMTDPVTGHVYQTTRGAARAAHHANMKHKLFGAGILSAGYMAGLHKLLNPKVPWWIKAPVAIAAGLKTYEGGQALARPFRNPEYLTDQGILVPGSTEFAKVSALTLPTYLDKVAFDVIERVGDQADPLLAIRQKVAAYAPKAAISRFLVSAEPDTEKAAALARGIEYDSDPLQPPQIDLDALSERVGALLLS